MAIVKAGKSCMNCKHSLREAQLKADLHGRFAWSWSYRPSIKCLALADAKTGSAIDADEALRSCAVANGLRYWEQGPEEPNLVQLHAECLKLNEERRAKERELEEKRNAERTPFGLVVKMIEEQSPRPWWQFWR